MLTGIPDRQLTVAPFKSLNEKEHGKRTGRQKSVKATLDAVVADMRQKWPDGSRTVQEWLEFANHKFPQGTAEEYVTAPGNEYKVCSHLLVVSCRALYTQEPCSYRPLWQTSSARRLGEWTPRAHSLVQPRARRATATCALWKQRAPLRWCGAPRWTSTAVAPAFRCDASTATVGAGPTSTRTRGLFSTSTDNVSTATSCSAATVNQRHTRR